MDQEFELTIPIASFGCQPAGRLKRLILPRASCLDRLRLALTRLICNHERNFAVEREPAPTRAAVRLRLHIGTDLPV
jgi:hypothetical protein